MTVTPEVPEVGAEAKKKFELSGSSLVGKQSSEHTVRSSIDISHPQNGMNPKKQCFMKDCGMCVTHLRRHMVGCHLPPCTALKHEMPLSARMSQFNNILLSIAKNVGCNNIFELLDLVRCRHLYPDGEHYVLTGMICNSRGTLLNGLLERR